MSGIIGRDREIKRLNKIKASRKSEFVAVFGRRRVGKTFLIREYFKYSFDFHLTGMANVNTMQQLMNFHNSLLRQSLVPVADQPPANWIEAFQMLIDHLLSIRENRKKVIFLDELPWLDTARSDFIPALEHFWNSWATSRKDIILITSGSAASWMINKLINSRGGLHNRVTERIKLHPFNLRETELMLRSRKHAMDRYQILLIYMVTGGIPFYLDNLEAGKSAWQNIEEICFRKGALLSREFPHLFASLFKNPEHHEAIVTALATKQKGLSRTELSKATGLTTGGGLTRLLTELEESGFISSYTPFNKKSRDRLYRLSDFYCNFYLKFIRGNTSFDEGVWVNAIDNPAQRAWAGFSYEQVCLSHVPQIKQALGIRGIVSKASTWRSTQPGEGAQIDLVIDRRDRVVTLCEIKFSIHQYTINKTYDLALRNKIEAFREETRTRKALYLTMITTFGLKQNEYAHSIVNNELTMDDLFEPLKG